MCVSIGPRIIGVQNLNKSWYQIDRLVSIVEDGEEVHLALSSSSSFACSSSSSSSFERVIVK